MTATMTKTIIAKTILIGTFHQIMMAPIQTYDFLLYNSHP